MKLSSLLPESTLTQLTESTKNVKVTIKSESGDKTPIDFLVYTVSGHITFLVKSSKGLELIDDLNVDEDSITYQLGEYVTKKTKVPFIGHYNHLGAGYGVTIDMEKILKKI